MERYTLSTTHVLTPPESSLTEEFLRSTIYGAVQSPLNGVAQLAERAGLKDASSAVQVMAAPSQQEFGSARWHVQQAGSAIGSALPFLMLHSCVRYGGRLLTGQYSKGALRNIAEYSLTGAAFEGLFRETSSDEPLLKARAANALSGAATMATLAATALGLQELGRVAGRSARLLSNELVSSVAAGIPAGIVNAETTAILHHGRSATNQEITQSAYTFVSVGGILGCARLAIDSRVRSTEASLAIEREALLQNRIDLEAMRKNLGERRQQLNVSKPTECLELAKVAATEMQTVLLLRSNKSRTIYNLEETIALRRKNGGTASSTRPLEIALDYLQGWLPQSKGSQFHIRSPKLGCSVPLTVRGKVPLIEGLDVVEHTIQSIERPTSLALVYDKKASYRGRANSMVDGHVILNFNDWESRVPVLDHEMGHVVDVRKITPADSINNLIQRAYESDLAQSNLSPVLKDVLTKTDYVSPRGTPDPIEAQIPSKLRRQGYYSSRAEIIAESYKVFLESKRAEGANATGPLSFEKLTEQCVLNRNRRGCLLQFENTYNALRDSVFEPMFVEETAKREGLWISEKDILP